MKHLSASLLKKVVLYDRKTGEFTWLVRKAKNTIIGGSAGSLSRAGYLYIRIDGQNYGAHRLAWLYVTGTWPIDDIDHRNHIKNDNRFENLRAVNRSVNMQNRKRAQKNNKLGFLGVCANSHGFHGYRAQICVGGRNKPLGVYRTPVQAHAAYLEAKRKLHTGNTL